MTLHLDIHRTASVLGRHERAVRALGVVTAGICWGISLALLGATSEAAAWFAVALVSFVAGACIAVGGLRALLRYRLALAMTFLVAAGLAIGGWMAG